MTKQSSHARHVYRFNRIHSIGPGIWLLLLAVTLSASESVFCDSNGASTNNGEYDITLDMSDPAVWTIDTVHLGTRQLEISYDAGEEAAVITPT